MRRLLAIVGAMVATSAHAKSIDPDMAVGWDARVSSGPLWLAPGVRVLNQPSQSTLKNTDRDIKSSGVILLSGSTQIRIRTTTTGTLVLRLAGDGEE